MTRAPKLIASAALVLVLATACGGDDGRPSADEISSAMQDNAEEFLGSADIPDDAIDWDCFGQAYYDSDVSDETLRAMVDQDEDYDPSDDDQAALVDVASSSTDCVDIEMPDLGESPSS